MLELYGLQAQSYTGVVIISNLLGKLRKEFKYLCVGFVILTFVSIISGSLYFLGKMVFLYFLGKRHFNLSTLGQLLW